MARPQVWQHRNGGVAGDLTQIKKEGRPDFPPLWNEWPGRTLLVAKGHNRIHAHSPARRNVRSRERNSDQKERDAKKRNRIVGAYAKEEACQEARKYEGTCQAKPKADEGQFESLAENHSAHIGALRAKRDA